MGIIKTERIDSEDEEAICKSLCFRFAERLLGTKVKRYLCRDYQVVESKLFHQKALMQASKPFDTFECTVLPKYVDVVKKILKDSKEEWNIGITNNIPTGLH